MVRRLKRIEPMSCGKVMAAFYGLMSLLFIPFFLLFALVASLAPNSQNGPPAAMAVGLGLVMAVIMPIMYAGMGFLLGLLSALIYNFVARHLGGIEVEVE